MKKIKKANLESDNQKLILISIYVWRTNCSHRVKLNVKKISISLKTLLYHIFS